MYTHPSTAEQCLHNALKIVNAMRYVGVDYDIQVFKDNLTSVTPILMIKISMLVIFLSPGSRYKNFKVYGFEF